MQPNPYLVSILSSVEAIESYLPKDEHIFKKDHKSQDAVLMRLQDIGENFSRLRDNFPDFWNEHSTNDWVKAIGLRNIISHGYAEINLDIIWVLVTKDLSRLRKSVKVLIS